MLAGTTANSGSLTLNDPLQAVQVYLIRSTRPDKPASNEWRRANPKPSLPDQMQTAAFVNANDSLACCGLFSSFRVKESGTRTRWQQNSNARLEPCTASCRRSRWQAYRGISTKRPEPTEFVRATSCHCLMNILIHRRKHRVHTSLKRQSRSWLRQGTNLPVHWRASLRLCVGSELAKCRVAQFRVFPGEVQSCFWHTAARGLLTFPECPTIDGRSGFFWPQRKSGGNDG